MIDKNIVEIFITSSGKLKSCWKTKLNDTIKEKDLTPKFGVINNKSKDKSVNVS